MFCDPVTLPLCTQGTAPAQRVLCFASPAYFFFSLASELASLVMSRPNVEPPPMIVSNLNTACPAYVDVRYPPLKTLTAVFSAWRVCCPWVACWGCWPAGGLFWLEAILFKTLQMRCGQYFLRIENWWERLRRNIYFDRLKWEGQLSMWLKRNDIRLVARRIGLQI